MTTPLGSAVESIGDAGSPPDSTTFGRRYAPGSPYHRALRELHRSLTALDSAAPLAGRVEAIEALVRWVRTGPKLPSLEGVARAIEPPPQARLRLLVQVLRDFPAWRRRTAIVIASILAETSSVHLFAEVGVPNTRGLWTETSDRLARRLLPTAVDPDDLAPVVARLFPAKHDIVWLSGVPGELFAELARELALGAPEITDLWQPLRAGMIDAVRLLATRTSSLGLTEELRARSHKLPLTETPFFRLPRACDRLIQTISEQGDTASVMADVRGRTEECRVELRAVLESLETSGVSVDVVYRLEVIGKCLDRLDAMLPLLVPAPTDDADGVRPATRMLQLLVTAGVKDHSIRELMRSNMRLLARKIIERAGVTGEHYITSTRREYFRMLGSAAGGGLLTAGTAALKFLIAWGHWAPFLEGFFSGLNYAVSFVVIQLLGFTLATKQPSMTAAALAHAIHGSGARHQLDELVTVIARITRSQLAAAMGNILVVIPAALLLDLVHVETTGRHFLDAKAATYVLHSLHPTESATIWFAALTGVILWLSSIVAGWVENWAVYRRLPEAIAQHRAGRWLGRRRMEAISRFFARNIAGFGGNISLGFMLGMTPVFGRFFGLPLDVRHVTLSAGSLTFAVAAGGAGDPVLYASIGIAVIFVLNLSVSFLLALTVALRARGVESKERFRLFVAIVRRFFRRPGEFFFPPRT